MTMKPGSREWWDKCFPCRCHEDYTSRGKKDPRCHGCDFREDATWMLRELAELKTAECRADVAAWLQEVADNAEGGGSDALLD